MSGDNFGKVFSYRCAICFFVSMLMFLSCLLRVAVVATSDYSLVQERQTSYRLKAGKARGTIYDCNMLPITNRKETILAAVSPTPRAITAISSLLSGEELESLLDRLKSGMPVVCRVPQYIDCEGIVCTSVYEHNSSDIPAVHLVGYTDADMKGMSGLEKAYDSLLYSPDDIAFVYTVGGKGDVLEGIKPTIENDSSVAADGVVSTLDINIQRIAERAAAPIETGAVVIADAKTSKIRACVSLPSFDCTRIKDFIKADDSPLFNRAVNAYNVGSVFKPCVAAAGIESGKKDFLYTCTGSCEIIDRFFRCHNRNGHGFMNLNSALAHSCNTYFYNYAFSVGEREIYNTASALGFGKKLDICSGLSTAAGNMPSLENLSNIAQLANFSIGQGMLLLSPVSMLTLYSSIAYDGTYRIPSVVEGTLSDGSFSPYRNESRTRVMSEETAAMLRNCLSGVITEGTGVSAKPLTVSAAGKTATAQTGRYSEGVEICEGWFCGFFPADNPEYVVIVFSENTDRQKKTCGEVFAQIADEITLMTAVDK